MTPAVNPFLLARVVTQPENFTPDMTQEQYEQRVKELYNEKLNGIIKAGRDVFAYALVEVAKVMPTGYRNLEIYKMAEKVVKENDNRSGD